jgi:hypothetical protein
LPAVPDFIDKRYDRSMKILERLAEGEMVLSNSVTVVSSQGDNYAWANGMDHHPIFDPVLSDMEQQADTDRINEALAVRALDVSSS